MLLIEISFESAQNFSNSFVRCGEWKASTNMSKTQNKQLPKHFDPAMPEFDLFQSPFYLIAHADFKFHEDLDKAVEKFGLDRTTYRLLTILMRSSPINIKELSSFALLPRSTTSRALDRMRKEGWVNRSPNAHDNRATNVYLSSTGRELAENVMRFGSRQLQRAVKGLSEEDLDNLARLLKHLVFNLSKLPIE